MYDARMLAVSDLYDDLENFAFCPAGRELRLYGDAAYPLRIHLQAAFRVGVLTRQMEMLRKNECSTCICRVVIRRHRQVFQISRFQKEFEDRFKSCW